MPSVPALLESHRAPIHVETVTLVVRNLDQVTAFYRDVIGLTVINASASCVELGNDGVVLLTLNGDSGAELAPEAAPGLFHTAFVLPGREHLGAWLATAARNGWQLEGMSDHLVSEAVYLSDPEGNGIEIYRDRPRSEWMREGDKVRMANARIDAGGLLSLADPAKIGGTWRMPPGARIGHVHLCVNSLQEATGTVGGAWGFDEMCRYPGAIFFATGGYHHHIATNVWRTDGKHKRLAGQSGLAAVTLAAADATAHAEFATRFGSGAGGRVTMLDGLEFALRH